jgi:hypothetical protein
MKGRGRVVAASVIVLVMGLAFAPLAGASDSLVTVVTTSTGSRTITLATAPVFPAQDLSLSGGNVVASGLSAASARLTELFASGATWSIKAEICSPNDYDLPTASDCTTGHADRLVRATGGAVADDLDGSTMTLQRVAPTVTGAPAGAVSPGTETTLASQVTLLSSSTELATTTYNGIYTVNTGVTITNLTRTGTWKGYWVVTQTT